MAAVTSCENALYTIFLSQLSIFRTLLRDTHIYINLHALLLHFLSSFNINFILIGHSKQGLQSRRTRGILKIERYSQRLTHRACLGEANSYSLAPAEDH